MEAEQLTPAELDDDNVDRPEFVPQAQERLEELLERAWQQRSNAPDEALSLLDRITGERAATGGTSITGPSLWIDVKVITIKASASLAKDEPHEATSSVLQGVEELVGRLPERTAAATWPSGRLTPPTPPTNLLAARLARINLEEIPLEHAETVTELLLVGLRSACLTNKIEESLPFGNAALQTAEHFHLATATARAHSDLASAYGMREFNSRATEHLRAGIATLEAAGEPVTPVLLNNLGNVYLSSNRIDEALGCFERARDGFAERGDGFREAIATSNQGRALERQRRFREAAGLHVEALRIFRELGRRPYIGATLAKLGGCYGAMGEVKRAQNWYEAALATYQDDELPFEGESREAYGRELLKIGEYERALEQLELAEIAVRREGIEVSAINLLRDQANALAELGRHEEAYERLALYIERSDDMEASQSESRLNVLLTELESGLTADHELPALSSRALAEANRTLRSQAQRLEQISATDELTELYNRRYLNRRLEEELLRARTGDLALSLVLFDVDNFKAINDQHSHLVGDEVLRTVAAKLRSTFRRTDVVARWGGEEFAVLLIQTDHEAALSVADKARTGVSGISWLHLQADLEVTISAGVASLEEVDGPNPGRELLKLVDDRLYRAKHQGRNRIVAS